MHLLDFTFRSPIFGLVKLPKNYSNIMSDNILGIDSIINSALRPKGWMDSLTVLQAFTEKLSELRLSKNQALRLMEIETKSFDAFMKGQSTKIDFLTVLKMSKFLDIAPSVFIDKFLVKITDENKNELDKTSVRLFIAKHFDLEVLRSAGLIETVNDFEQIEQRILSFFGYNTVFEYKNDIEVPVYSKGKIVSNEKTLKFWVNMAYATFEKMPNPNEYDRQELVRIFPALRAYSLNVESGLRQVFKLLFKVGVTVIFIPKNYKDLHIRAATFVIDDKPCIAITNYRDLYPTLWFSLFHELYHVLYDWEEIVNSAGHGHVSAGMSTGTIDEDAANQFSARYLFDDDKMKEVEPYIDKPSYVAKFARSYNVHESIVYALYAHKYSNNENKLFAKYRHFMKNPKEAIEAFNPEQYATFKPIPAIAKTTMSLIN